SDQAAVLVLIDCAVVFGAHTHDTGLGSARSADHLGCSLLRSRTQDVRNSSLHARASWRRGLARGWSGASRRRRAAPLSSRPEPLERRAVPTPVAVRDQAARWRRVVVRARLALFWTRRCSAHALGAVARGPTRVRPATVPHR